MIHFEKVTWKNFLSTGNTETTIDLDAKMSMIVLGKNGGGKSTMIDAICFALFGKPFRKVKKLQLVNSINEKACLVQIWFRANGKKYHIVRGIKPNKFEIYQDGVLLNQTASARDYQSILEQQILKLNMKTFTQVVVLGSANYTPFMALPAWQRREVVEEVLDIKVFSQMNSILKEDYAKTKATIKTLDKDIEFAKSKVEAQKRLIETIKGSKEEKIGILETRRNELLLDYEAYGEQLTALKLELEEQEEIRKKYKPAVKALSVAVERITKVSIDISRLETQIKSLKEQEYCSHCEQVVTEEHKQKMLSKLVSELEKAKTKLKQLDDAVVPIKADKELYDAADSKIKDLENSINSDQKNLDRISVSISNVETSIEEVKENNKALEPEQDELKRIAKDAINVIEKKKELVKKKAIQEVCVGLLKDDGVKAAIIREYLPAMNELINGFLTSMDSYVLFELDEEFNENIRSRYRDEFSYESFSEGEKQKIDLALMFAWRQIARMKNSANTNLLILDEVFDSSLDSEATDSLLNILDTLPKGTTTLVISHKEALHDKFEKTLEFRKEGNFSVLVN